MIKVLFLSHADDSFGAPKSMMKLIELLLLKKDIKPIVVTGKKNKINQYCNDLGIENYSVRFVNLGQYVEKVNTKFKLKRYLYYVINKVATIRLYRLIKNTNPNLIHTNISVIDLGMKVSEKFGLPHVWHLRELLNRENGWKYYDAPNLEKMNQNTSIFIAISHTVKNFWVGLGIDESKIEVIYNGVEIVENENGHEKKKKSNDMNCVLIGSLYPHKGQREIILGMSKVEKKFLDHIHIDFIGEGDLHYRSELEQLISKYSLESNISLIGYKDNAASMIHNYDVGIVSSRSEAFGRTTIEYMLNKLTVIASNRGANSEILKGKYGYLYDIDDCYSFSSCITSVYKNIKTLDTEQIAAYTYAKENFSVSQNADKVYEVYKRIMKG